MHYTFPYFTSHFSVYAVTGTYKKSLQVVVLGWRVMEEENGTMFSLGTFCYLGTSTKPAVQEHATEPPSTSCSHPTTQHPLNYMLMCTDAIYPYIILLTIIHE